MAVEKMKESRSAHREDVLAPAASGSDDVSDSDLEKSAELTAAYGGFATQDDEAVVTLKTWAVVVVGSC